MALRGLFGPKVELSVETDKAAYLPGETVTATISVRATKDLEIEEGRAELVYENEYSYREQYRNSDGSVEVSEPTTTDRLVHTTEPFLQPGAVATGAGHEYTVALKLPDDAIASGEGEITKVRWKVKAILSRRRANDPDAHTVFTVLSPPDAYAPSTEAGVDANDDCDLDLHLTGSRDVRPGDTVAGTLIVTPRSALDAKEVRVELVRHEDVPRDNGNEEYAVLASTVVTENPELTTAVPREYPFELPLPGGMCPSLETDQSTVRWYVRGVVARRLRSDYNIAQELNVYTAPSSGSS
jgi:Arrestin (or S-antigen), C-terminal domain